MARTTLFVTTSVGFAVVTYSSSGGPMNGTSISTKGTITDKALCRDRISNRYHQPGLCVTEPKFYAGRVAFNLANHLDKLLYRCSGYRRSTPVALHSQTS